jgi:hypothetical protein
MILAAAAPFVVLASSKNGSRRADCSAIITGTRLIKDDTVVTVHGVSGDLHLVGTSNKYCRNAYSLFTIFLLHTSMSKQEVVLPVISDIPESSPASKYTTQERLLLSQAVYKLGSVPWPAISALLLEHPCCLGRPVELFSPEGCEGAYVGLMGSIGQNV